MFGRQRIAAVLAEFLGAGVLTLAYFTVKYSQFGLSIFVGLGVAVAVALATILFAKSSGAHFNPAITLGMFAVRRITFLRAVAYIFFQFLGAAAAYLLFTYFVNNKLQDLKLEYNTRILVAEALGALIIGFAYAAVVFNRVSIGIRAAVTGLAYLVGILIASTVSLGLLNPALAVGAKAFEWTTYIAGPFLGALIAIALYKLVFADDEAVSGVQPVAEVSSLTVAETATEKTVTATKSTTVKKPRATTRTKATTTRARSTTAKKAPVKKATTTTRRKKV